MLFNQCDIFDRGRLFWLILLFYIYQAMLSNEIFKSQKHVIGRFFLTRVCRTCIFASW